MNKFAFYLMLFSVVALAASPHSATQNQPPTKRPNIVFIMSDDHAAHAISAYGSRLIKTPNVDRLAKEGMKFENCFVTNSICTPSRAAILTGKYSHLNGVPFLIRWPGKIRPGGVSKGMILNVDFAPTLLDAAGVKAPADMQGRSFGAWLEGKTPQRWRAAMYYRYYHPGHHNVAAHYGVRTDRYKLIYFNKLDQWELYDLRKDPREMRNVYSDPAHAKIVEELKKELYRLKKELKDGDQFANELPKDDVG